MYSECRFHLRPGLYFLFFFIYILILRQEKYVIIQLIKLTVLFRKSKSSKMIKSNTYRIVELNQGVRV